MKLAKLISLIFQPVFLTLLIIFVLVNKYSKDNFYAFKWASYSVIFMFLGVIIFIWARHKRIFSDFDVSKRHERYDLYLLLFVFSAIYFVTTAGFKGLYFPLTLVSFGILSAIILFFLVNFFTKLSLHLAVLSAFITTVSLLYGWRIFLSIFILIPVVAWSRIVLRKHTLLEVIVGIILGVIATVITFLIGKDFLYL